MQTTPARASADAEAMDPSTRSSKKHKRACAASGTALWVSKLSLCSPSTSAFADALCGHAPMHKAPDVSSVVAVATVVQCNCCTKHCSTAETWLLYKPLNCAILNCNATLNVASFQPALQNKLPLAGKAAPTDLKQWHLAWKK